MAKARQQSKQMRRLFFRAFFQQTRILWPIFSGILVVMAGCGVIIGRIESWRLGEALYFTFVTGLTIGYGDITPEHFSSRLLALLIGLSGIVMTGLVAAVSVQALRATIAITRIESASIPVTASECLLPIAKSLVHSQHIAHPPRAIAMATRTMPIATIRQPARHGLPTCWPKVKPARNSIATATTFESLKASVTSSTTEKRRSNREETEKDKQEDAEGGQIVLLAEPASRLWGGTCRDGGGCARGRMG